MFDFFLKFFNKYKELFLYAIFGVLTTLVSYVVFYFFYSGLGINELISNFLSWTAGVTFSFFTNRKFVFEKTNNNISAEFIKFVSSRILTFLFNELMILIFVTLLKYNAFIVKIISDFFVVVFNYIFSKYIVFKKH